MVVDETYHVASSPNAPPNEAIAARAEMMQTFAPTRSDLPNPTDVASLVEALAAEYDQAPGLHKGHLWPYAGMGELPSQSGITRSRAPHEPKSVFVDEFGIVGSVPGGYITRPSAFGADHLRLMVEHTPLINAIILRRIRQIGRFLRPKESDREIGFAVRRMDGSDDANQKRDKRERAIEQFLLHGGWARTLQAKRALNRDGLTEFMAKSLRDILTLDAWAIETVPTRNNKLLDGFHCIDAATIYLASEEGYAGDDEVIAVQVVNGQPLTTFTAHEIAYLAQNPRSDIRSGGYGYAPPEMIVKVVTGYLNALTYNLKGFDTNAIPKGLLTLFGSFDTKQLAFFKQQWNSMVKGVNNSWAMPVMVSENKESGAEFTKFGVEFNEMYFSKWIVLVTAIICSVYGMDPSEVYSESFSAGKSSLSGSDMAERIADARDTGLEPLMSFIENGLTDALILRLDEDCVFRFFGLHPYDVAWKHEVAKLTLTANELRKQDGNDPAEGAWGNVPLNPMLQAAYQAAQQAAQGGHPGMSEGASGGSPGPEPETSGERDEAGRPVQARLTDSVDRDEAAATGPVNRPEVAERDKGRSTMAFRKAILGSSVVVVG